MFQVTFTKRLTHHLNMKMHLTTADVKGSKKHIAEVINNRSTIQSIQFRRCSLSPDNLCTPQDYCYIIYLQVPGHRYPPLNKTKLSHQVLWNLARDLMNVSFSKLKTIFSEPFSPKIMVKTFRTVSSVHLFSAVRLHSVTLGRRRFRTWT